MFKVLVVDDEENIREAISEFLENEGDYEVFLAEDGYRALEIFKAQSIDLVFMDVKMPGLDGIEVFHKMRQLKPEINVVIITGLPDEQSFDRALTVSEEVLQGFIAKPFKPADLRKCLQNVLAGNRHSTFQLTPGQLESLGQVTSASMKTVSQAFTQIIHKDTKIALQNVKAIPLSQISKPLEEPGVSSVGVLTKVSGDVNGTVFFLVSWPDGLVLTDLLQKAKPGTAKIFDEVSQAGLKSLGTVLSGVYLKTFSEQVNLSMRPEQSKLVFEHRNDVIKSIAQGLNTVWENEGEYLFTIETELSIINPAIKCWFLLIPTADSLKSVFRALRTFK